MGDGLARTYDHECSDKATRSDHAHQATPLPIGAPAMTDTPYASPVWNETEAKEKVAASRRHLGSGERVIAIFPKATPRLTLLVTNRRVFSCSMTAPSLSSFYPAEYKGAYLNDVMAAYAIKKMFKRADLTLILRSQLHPLKIGGMRGEEIDVVVEWVNRAMELHQKESAAPPEWKAPPKRKKFTTKKKARRRTKAEIAEAVRFVEEHSGNSDSVWIPRSVSQKYVHAALKYTHWLDMVAETLDETGNRRRDRSDYSGQLARSEKALTAAKAAAYSAIPVEVAGTPSTTDAAQAAFERGIFTVWAKGLKRTGTNRGLRPPMNSPTI